MSPPSSTTVRRSFIGVVSLPDGNVPATVEFNNGSVRLYVIGDAVGTWPRSEVEFRAVEEGYELHAEGDFLRFVPEETSAFDDFLAGPTELPTQQERSAPEAAAVPVEAPAVRPPRPRETHRPHPGTLAHQPPTPVQSDTFLAPLGEPQDQQGLLVDEEPDEYFAAGFNGPPTTASSAPPAAAPQSKQAPTAQSSSPTPPSITPPPQAAPGPRPSTPTLPPAAPRHQPASPSSPRSSASPASTTPRSPVAAPSEPAPEAPRPAPPTEPSADVLPPVAPAPRPAPVAESPAPAPEPAAQPTSSAVASPPSPAAPEPQAPAAAPSSSPADDPSESRPNPSRLAQRLRQARRAEKHERPAPSVEEPAEDDTPAPLSDAENLRQWGIVIGGAVLLLAILGVAAWAVLSSLVGEEPAATPETVTTPATSVPPPPTTTTTAPPPSTTVSPENAAAAAAFVDSWNAIAAQYGFHHLTIAGEALPLSSAPVPAVHLIYDEDGALELSMAPEGTGSDRDILYAMGIAVAWADPSLSPEARRDVLGALGVDVDDPKISDMGGELSRNGVTYSIEVRNEVLRFRVQPGS